MAVQPQTPYKEYDANGVTTSFALEFDCEKKDHLIVTVDGAEPPVETWSLNSGHIVFASAPAAGKKIEIKRNTPYSRSTNFQAYDNSFRPGPINGDFDRLWLKLQELGVADWLMKLYVDRLHQQQEVKINDLKSYVDDRDDELRSYLMEEIRKQGVALDQLDEYYNYLMQRLAQIAVDKGWDASFVVDGTQNQKEINLYGAKTYDMPAGGYPVGGLVRLANGDIVQSTIPNNTNDPNADMAGWFNISREQRIFKDKLYVTPYDFGYTNTPGKDFNVYLQMAIDSGHRVIKGNESDVSVNIKSPVFVRSNNLNIDLSMITATVDPISVSNVWTQYGIPIFAGYTAAGIINIHGAPNNDYKTVSVMPTVGSNVIQLNGHGYTLGQKIGLEIEYKAGLVLKNRLLVNVKKVIDTNNFVIDYEFFFAPLTLRTHTFSNVVNGVTLKSYKKITDTNTATATSSAFACTSIAWAENCETEGSEWINGALSSLRYYMANNCEDYSVVTKQPRATGGGQGYTVQNLFSRNIQSNEPENFGGRHVYDFSGAVFSEVHNPRSYYLTASTPVLLTHGIFEHDLIIDNPVDVGSTVPEIGLGHAGEEFGRTSRNIQITNPNVATIRLDSVGCRDVVVEGGECVTFIAGSNTEIIGTKVTSILNIQALDGFVKCRGATIAYSYVNPQYLNASGTAVYQDSTADLLFDRECSLDRLGQSTYKVKSIKFKNSKQVYTTETASHYDLIATDSIIYEACELSSVNTKATGNTLSAPFIHFDADCVLKDISYIIKTPSYGDFIFSGKYKEPTIDKTNPLIDLTNSSIYAQFFFKNARLNHKYASAAGGADLAIKSSVGGRCVLEISNSFVKNNVDFTANLGAVYTLICVSNIWQSSNFVAGTNTANKIFANNAVFAT